jgi:hypothetical protein
MQGSVGERLNKVKIANRQRSLVGSSVGSCLNRVKIREAQSMHVRTLPRVIRETLVASEQTDLLVRMPPLKKYIFNVLIALKH